MDEDIRLTVDQLADVSATTIEDLGIRPRNAQVGSRPDRRMLRFYTMLGLLDPPAEVRGRTAYYGRRHVLQVVAAKRLQAEGLTLTDIQSRLANATTDELAAVARVPTPTPSRPRRVRRPAPPTVDRPRRGGRPSAVRARAVDLGRGVTLVLPPGRPLRSRDVAAVGQTASPLLAHLAERGLIPHEKGEER
jgi:DNA-binding transcriptional MerR regulator